MLKCKKCGGDLKYLTYSNYTNSYDIKEIKEGGLIVTDNYDLDFHKEIDETLICKKCSSEFKLKEYDVTLNEIAIEGDN